MWYTTFVYYEIQSVVVNASITGSTLKKKRNSVAYHFISEESEKYKWIYRRVGKDVNLSELMTKLSLYSNNHIRRVRMLMYYI